MSFTSTLKGWLGETLGSVAHWVYLDGSVYRSLNNLTLPTKNGTTQIDHVIVSKFGLFVIEAKNIDGWIFGDERSPHWSVVKPGRKFRMQNPLHQNYRHVKAIAEYLAIEEDQIHSLVMFWGDCEFKTTMPKNVMLKGYATYIKSFARELLTEEEVGSFVELLRSGSLPKSWATRQAHVASLRTRHASTTICPKCSTALVLRTVRTGANAGSQFYGCKSYPKCRYTKPYRTEA